MILSSFSLLQGDAHVVLFIASTSLYLGMFFHEAGHWVAAKAFGVGAVKFVFFPRRAQVPPGGVRNFFNRYAAGAGIDVAFVEFRLLPIMHQRIIILGGVSADVFVTILAWTWIDILPIEICWAQGILLGLLVRSSVGLAFNLIPMAAFKNDGWRLLNLNSMD